jgi:hypothetical protein
MATVMPCDFRAIGFDSIFPDDVGTPITVMNRTEKADLSGA